MVTDKLPTEQELAAALRASAQQVYASAAQGPKASAAAREKHALLLKQYEERFGSDRLAAIPLGSNTAHPSGIPWCSDRCGPDGRVLPGR